MASEDIPTQPRNKGLFRKGRHFLREVLILVIGIMISFLINDYRQNRQFAKEEADVIEQLHADLQTDTAIIRANLRDLQLIEDKYDYYMEKRGEGFDSLDVESFTSQMYSFISLVPFNPNQTAYVQLTLQSKIDRINDKELLAEAIRLYDDIYQNIELVNDMHGKCVVDNISGMLFDVLPASVDKPFESGQKARVRDFLYSDAVANRLEFVVILVLNLKSIYQDALEKIDGLLHFIESDYDFEN